MKTSNESLQMNIAMELLRRHVLDHGHCEFPAVCDCGDAQARRFIAEYDSDPTWLEPSP